MKVSKPIIIALILAIVFSAYILFFTGGKKRPSKTLPPTEAATKALPASSQPSEFPVGQHEATRQKIVKVNFTWDRDPFQLPKLIDKRFFEQPKIGVKLVAVIDGKQGRLAIIGNDIVKKGDFIGDEKVLEIGEDRVVLIRKGQRRVIPVANMVSETFIKEPSTVVQK